MKSIRSQKRGTGRQEEKGGGRDWIKNGPNSIPFNIWIKNLRLKLRQGETIANKGKRALGARSKGKGKALILEEEDKLKI